MPYFFSTPSNLLVEHELALVEFQAKKVKFNHQDPLHTKLVTACAKSVRDKLADLQSIDIKITAGFALGTAALFLSYILPFALVATTAFAYASYQLGKRQAAYLDYTSALENLSKCCIWTLGVVSPEQARDPEFMNNPAIEDMKTTMAPLMSSQQLRDFIDDKVEDGVIAEADQIKKDIMIFDEHLPKEKVDLYFKIYGYKQGGFLAILEGVWATISSGFTSLKTAITSKFSGPAAELVADSVLASPSPK